MEVVVSRRLVDKFKHVARAAFPREAYAILLGKPNGTKLHVTALYIPDGQEQFCTRNRVHVQDMWWVEARAIAKADDCDIVGDIHSHAESSKYEMDAAPSEGDWDRAPEIRALVHAICAVRRYPSGRMAARVRFWPTYTGLTEKITD